MEAARIGDMTDHGGSVTSMAPGFPIVNIEKMPAATVGSLHICAIVAPPPHAPGPFNSGSSKVFINKKAALRVGDVCDSCGASIILARKAKVKIG